MQIQGFNIFIRPSLGFIGFDLVSQGICFPYGILHKLGIAKLLGTSTLRLKFRNSKNIVLNLSEQKEKDIYI